MGMLHEEVQTNFLFQWLLLYRVSTIHLETLTFILSFKSHLGSIYSQITQIRQPSQSYIFYR